MQELVQILKDFDSGAYDLVFLAFVFPIAIIVIYDLWKNPK